MVGGGPPVFPRLGEVWCQAPYPSRTAGRMDRDPPTSPLVGGAAGNALEGGDFETLGAPRVGRRGFGFRCSRHWDHPFAARSRGSATLRFVSINCELRANHRKARATALRALL